MKTRNAEFMTCNLHVMCWCPHDDPCKCPTNLRLEPMLPHPVSVGAFKPRIMFLDKIAPCLSSMSPNQANAC